MIVAFLAITLVSVAVTTRTSTGASIGLALVNVVAFGANLKGLVYNWTALEIAMGAIARIQDSRRIPRARINRMQASLRPQIGLIKA